MTMRGEIGWLVGKREWTFFSVVAWQKLKKAGKFEIPNTTGPSRGSYVTTSL